MFMLKHFIGNVGSWCLNPSTYFNFDYKLDTRKRTHVLDSLVRVSRRVVWNHFYFQRLLPHNMGGACTCLQTGLLA